MKKNIVLVISDLGGGGAERFVITLSDAFKKSGHSCHVICFNNNKALPSTRGVKPFIFPIKYFKWIPRRIRGRLTAPFFDFFIRNKFGSPNLILSNLHSVDRILAYSKLDNVYLVIHSTLSKEFNLEDKKSTLRKKINLQTTYCRKPLVCVSDGVEKDIKMTLGCPIKTHRIYNPIDTKFIQKQSKSHQLSISLPPEYLLHVGSFNDAKRHSFLIKAYALSKVTTPLVLMGQGSLQVQCEKLVEQLNIKRNVIFIGFQHNPYPIIANAKAFILSSGYEGLSMVILEALSLGVPSISTDCDSGPREILPSKNLFPVDSIEDFSIAIQKVDKTPYAYKHELQKQFFLKEGIQQYLKLGI